MGGCRSRAAVRGGHLSAEEFLSRCQKVRRTGQGRWIASCPAHEDSTPSMNVKEMPDGKLLVICRAGCSMQEILDATGLPWSVLFGESEGQYRREAKKAFPASDVLIALESEALLVAVAASNIANGVQLTDEDRARLMLAYQRIDAARSMALERR